MPKTTHAFDFLASPKTLPTTAVCIVFGDEPFLKRLALKELCHRTLGDDEDDMPFTRFEGKTAEWRDVLDELSTASLFGGGPRLAAIEQADDFVSRHRGQLEEYVAKPKSTGMLVLEVNTWQSNTRLFKAIAKSGLQIECRAPEISRGKRKVLDEDRLCRWLIAWSKTEHDAALHPKAVDLLLEMVGPEFGLLDQEIAKLALFAGRGGTITDTMVRDVVGGWRTKTTWELIDAAADGDASEALRQLDRLLQAGEHPVALLGQIAWSLRRFATATRIIEQSECGARRIRLRDALEQAGFHKWPARVLENAERQLIQLGRQRAGQFHRWLLETDLSLKGSHSSPERARFVLEQLFLRMSKELKPPANRPTTTAAK